MMDSGIPGGQSDRTKCPQAYGSCSSRTQGGAIHLSENTGDGPDGGCCCLRLMMGI